MGFDKCRTLYIHHYGFAALNIPCASSIESSPLTFLLALNDHFTLLIVLPFPEYCIFGIVRDFKVITFVQYSSKSSISVLLVMNPSFFQFLWKMHLEFHLCAHTQTILGQLCVCIFA